MGSPFTDLLSQVQHELGETGNLRDPTVFDTDTALRNGLVVQRDELRPLLTHLVQFLQFGNRQHLCVIGPRGSGKTQLVAYTLNELTAQPGLNVTAHYVNCHLHQNTYRVLRCLSHQTHRHCAELLTNLTTVFSQTTKHVLVLDEIECLRDDLLLYHLSRDPAFNHVQLVLLTKTPTFFKRLSMDVQSSCHLSIIHFSSYNIDTLAEILRRRAKVGLDSYDDQALFRIAHANHQIAHSDVRIGLAATRTIFQTVAYPRVRPGTLILPDADADYIERTVQREYQRLKTGLLHGLNHTQLWCAYLALQRGYSNKAYDAYLAHLRADAGRPMSRGTFLAHLAELAYLDLFQLIPERQGRSTVLKIHSKLDADNSALLASLVRDRLAYDAHTPLPERDDIGDTTL